MRTHEEIVSILSMERFQRYLDWSKNDLDQAINLYRLNVLISEAFYTPMHIIEIILRNKIDYTMKLTYGAQWVHDTNIIKLASQLRLTQEARFHIRNKSESTQIIPELPLGFWTSMFSKEYENLWQTTLHKIATRENGKGLRRKDFSAPLAKIREVRNRVAHHEPILTYNILEIHDQIIRLTQWMSPPAADWIRRDSRLPLVCPQHPIIPPAPPAGKT